MGTRGSFPGGKGPGREANHSPPSGAEAKSAWIYTSTPPILLHGVELGLKKAEWQIYLFMESSVFLTGMFIWKIEMKSDVVPDMKY